MMKSVLEVKMRQPPFACVWFGLLAKSLFKSEGRILRTSPGKVAMGPENGPSPCRHVLDSGGGLISQNQSFNDKAN